jgi:hypothetical protein
MQATHELGIDRISAQSRGLHIYYALRGYFWVKLKAGVPENLSARRRHFVAKPLPSLHMLVTRNAHNKSLKTTWCPTPSFPFPTYLPIGSQRRAPGPFANQSCRQRSQSMYWSNQEIDTRTYPARCPGCKRDELARF